MIFTTAPFNQIIGINEDAKWKDIVTAYDKKMDELVAKMSTYDTKGVSPNEDPQIQKWTSNMIQLTNEIKKILTNRIDRAVGILNGKIDSLEKEIKNTSDELFVNSKSNKKEKLGEFKKKLETIKTNLNSEDEAKQIDYARACQEIQAAALNARSGVDDHTGSFYKFINWALKTIGISSIKIRTNTETQIDKAEETIYDTITPSSIGILK
ncbi:Uncharacterised protein [Legionella lansingensis]|uniref:Uncharacterized protein n=1 Tax=Legionella lansingensis TaxID=45067 RepID=A0A0W0VZ82_9GAMM|nr:hypothetical protein [Legionella lansingensis]KTD25420.1 hypothetical protein Llan_0166 [Legionella lansingensis]SNV51412.1 Uncharacterised protein [Legionella lansingensis]